MANQRAVVFSKEALLRENYHNVPCMKCCTFHYTMSLTLVTTLSNHLFNEFITLKGVREAGLEHCFNLFPNINLLGLL